MSGISAAVHVKYAAKPPLGARRDKGARRPPYYRGGRFPDPRTCIGARTACMMGTRSAGQPGTTAAASHPSAARSGLPARGVRSCDPTVRVTDLTFACAGAPR